MNTFHLEIVSPEGVLFNQEVEEVTIPTANGEIGVLPHHIPLFTKLSEGEVRIKKNKKLVSFAIAGGFLEVNKSTVTIISDYAIEAESIQVARSQEAKKRAEKLLEEKGQEADFSLIEKDLQRSILELKIADKVKKRQHN